jgi:BON domain
MNTAGRRWLLILLAGVLVLGVACSKTPDDTQVTSQIQSKFSQDSGLQGQPITVQTSSGVVTLSGTVENETQRAAAARYASAIPGIKTVVNNLEIASTAAPPTRAVDQIAKSASPALEKRSAKPRPGTPRHRSEPSSTDAAGNDVAANDMAARNDPARNDPPSAVADQSTPNQNPAPAPPTPAPPRKVTVPSGTSIAIRLVDPIDSEKAQPGQTFRATLDSALPSDGDALPSGYDVKGHIEDVKSAGKFAGQSLLVLQLDSITVGGKSYAIEADPYRRQGKNRSTNTAEKVGAGAVIGAIIGGIAGGGKGAGIGAAAGGGVGGGVQAATKGQQIVLPSETVVSFSLRAPLTVTLADKGPDSRRQKLDAQQ